MEEKNNHRPYSHYFIIVIAIPIILLIGSCVLIYFLSVYFGLSYADRIVGLLAVWMIFLFQRFKMRLNWAELPGRTFYYSKNTKSNKVNRVNKYFIEPAFYEKEFSYSKDSKITSLGLGALMIGLSYFFLSKKDIILPVILCSGGLYFIINNTRALLSGPVIKISKQGIWTKETGYLPWTEITKICLSRELNLKTSDSYLDIFLIRDIETRKSPSFRVSVNDIKDYTDIDNAIMKAKGLV